VIDRMRRRADDDRVSDEKPPGPPRGQFQKGNDPRRNAGGKVSLKRDLEAMGLLNPNLPSTPAEARARWWAVVMEVALDGPAGPKDSNWTYAAKEVGDRLLGRPKETVEIQQGESDTPRREPSEMSDTEIDEALEAVRTLKRLRAIAADDGPTEH
jgi:hypothetical protein